MDLFAFPRVQHRQNHMLHMPGGLVFHDVLFSLSQDLLQQRGDVGLVAELGDGCEERFEVEDDGAR